MSYETFVQEARAQLECTLDAIHEHAAKVFETHELVFNQVDQMLAGMSDDDIHAHEQDIHDRLGVLDTKLDQVDEIFLLSRDGHALASGQIYPVPPTANLLFTDVVMPGMDGRRLADAALQRKPGLKVLFMTGYTPNAIIHNGVLDLGTQLLSKPFAIAQLAEKLRIVLGNGVLKEP